MLAKYVSECRVLSDLELSGNFDIKVWFIRKIDLGFLHRPNQTGIPAGYGCT